MPLEIIVYIIILQVHISYILYSYNILVYYRPVISSSCQRVFPKTYQLRADKWQSLWRETRWWPLYAYAIAATPSSIDRCTRQFICIEHIHSLYIIINYVTLQSWALRGRHARVECFNIIEFILTYILSNWKVKTSYLCSLVGIVRC